MKYIQQILAKLNVFKLVEDKIQNPFPIFLRQLVQKRVEIGHFRGSKLFDFTALICAKKLKF